MSTPAPVLPPWAPRYWIPGYDTPSLAAPVVLAAVLLLLAVLPTPKVPIVRRPPPLPPLAATLITRPVPGAVLIAGQAFDLAGTAQPGGTVRLYYGTRILSQSTAEPDGSFRFQLSRFPVGIHSLRVEAVAHGRSQWSTELQLRFEAARPAAPVKAKSVKPPAKKKAPALAH